MAYGRTTPIGDDGEFVIQTDAGDYGAGSSIYGMATTASGLLPTVPTANAFTRTSDGDTTGIVATTYGTSPMALTTVFELYNVAVPIVDAAASGSQGNVKLCDFPVGRIAPFGGQVKLFTATASGGVAADANYEIGVGSTVATGALTTTEEDFVTGVASGDASSSAWSGVSLAAVSLAGTTSLDGNPTAIAAYLNFGTASDAEATANGTITISRATIVVHWGYVGTE